MKRRLRVASPPAQQLAVPAAVPFAEEPKPKAAGGRARWLGVGLLLTSVAVLGCFRPGQGALIALARPAQTNILAASPAEAMPAETPVPTLTPIQIPVLAGTPYLPPRELLGPENAARIAQLARLGKGWVLEVAFSPDGGMLAVASSLGVYLYDAVSLAEVRFLPMDALAIGVAFSPDGRTLASASG